MVKFVGKLKISEQAMPRMSPCKLSSALAFQPVHISVAFWKTIWRELKFGTQDFWAAESIFVVKYRSREHGTRNMKAPRILYLALFFNGFSEVVEIWYPRAFKGCWVDFQTQEPGSNQSESVWNLGTYFWKIIKSLQKIVIFR